MTKLCDHKSVGVIIKNDAGEILLIERKKFPFGFAPPAGHVDDFASPEACARGEVEEEVGLTVTTLTLLHEETKQNPCRREGGDHHHWWVYEAEVTGEVQGSEDETKQVGWYNQEKISALTERTEACLRGEMNETEWEVSPGLEPVWAELFNTLGIA